MPTVMLPRANPVTLSEKVKVAVNAPVWVALGPVIAKVGAVTSAPTENWDAAVLPLPAASVAASAATSTVTVPSADGVIVAV